MNIITLSNNWNENNKLYQQYGDAVYRMVRKYGGDISFYNLDDSKVPLYEKINVCGFGDLFSYIARKIEMENYSDMKPDLSDPRMIKDWYGA